MAEVETPIVTEENRLATMKVTGSILERWIEGSPERALEKLETLTKVLEKMRLHAIRQTYPSDWVIHTTLKDGVVIKQVGYLQDSGAERAGKIFGIEIGQPVIEREDFTVDSTFAYHMTADAWSKITGERIEHVDGSRWSGDLFFSRQVKDEGDRVDPTDVRKAAYANLHGRAVRSLAGLSAVPLEILKEAGLDTARCLFVGYEQGARGGESVGASVGSADVKVAFGRSAGKTPAELQDNDLDWYIKAYGENVVDEGKKKFRKANEQVLNALKAEKEKRAQGKAHEEATGTKAGDPPPAGTPAGAPTGADTPVGGSGTEQPTAVGTKRANAWALLQAAAGKNAVALLRLVTKDLGHERAGMSELTEAELDQVIGLGEVALKKTAETLPKGK